MQNQTMGPAYTAFHQEGTGYAGHVMWMSMTGDVTEIVIIALIGVFENKGLDPLKQDKR